MVKGRKIRGVNQLKLSFLLPAHSPFLENGQLGNCKQGTRFFELMPKLEVLLNHRKRTVVPLMQKAALLEIVTSLRQKLKLEEALDLLYAYVKGHDEELENTLILHLGSYNSNARKQRMGVQTSEESSLALTRLNYRIGETLKELPDQGNEISELMAKFRKPTSVSMGEPTVDTPVEAENELERLRWDSDLRKLRDLLAGLIYDYDDYTARVRSFNVPIDRLTFTRNARNDWGTILEYYMLGFSKEVALTKMIELLEEVQGDFSGQVEITEAVENLRSK